MTELLVAVVAVRQAVKAAEAADAADEKADAAVERGAPPYECARLRKVANDLRRTAKELDADARPRAAE